MYCSMQHCSSSVKMSNSPNNSGAVAGCCRCNQNSNTVCRLLTTVLILSTAMFGTSSSTSPGGVGSPGSDGATSLDHSSLPGAMSDVPMTSSLGWDRRDPGFVISTSDTVMGRCNDKALAMLDERELLGDLANQTTVEPIFITNLMASALWIDISPSQGLTDSLQPMLPETKLHQSYSEIYTGLFDSLLTASLLSWRLENETRLMCGSVKFRHGDETSMFCELHAAYQELFHWLSSYLLCRVSHLLKSHSALPDTPDSSTAQILNYFDQDCRKPFRNEKLAQHCKRRDLAFILKVRELRRIIGIKSNYLLLVGQEL